MLSFDRLTTNSGCYESEIEEAVYNMIGLFPTVFCVLLLYNSGVLFFINPEQIVQKLDIVGPNK